LWYWPVGPDRGSIAAAIERPAALADRTLTDLHRIEPGLPGALELLALTYALPTLAEEISPECWWTLARRLHDLAVEAQELHVDWRAEPRDALRQQLLAGELPLALGFLFPEVSPLRALRRGARANLSEAILELTDGEGMPHARLLPVLGPLFACWTRARWLGRRLARGAWSRPAEYQYQWLVRHVIRLAEASGRLVLTPGDPPTPRWSRSPFTMALDLAGDKRDCAAAAAALSARVVPKQIRYNPHRLPKPSIDSDWSGVSVLATGWSRSSVRLSMAYADEPVHLELAAGGERLLAGPWRFETTCDGKPVRVEGEWENLCWQSDKSCDVLELGVPLSAGLRLERQIVLGRRDRVLYLADMILAADGTPRRIKHSLGLPLDHRARWQPEAETRDGCVRSGQMRAAVLPLALPEWRADPRVGSLVEDNGRLVLTQEATGRALCCPLFLDLQPQRARKVRTWRQLTVAEAMEIVPRDVAVGFRAQSGGDQWLFYRSLGAAGNRTVLGQNIAGEFSAGRFRANGKFAEWIEIEAV
jgi:hypothetical protein